ncbi:manganese efflux pump [Tumidithrix elongata RA019]|uniref:Manganese efflux pump n=1 Tax=Tumidithrix elongata BACA0141 TaxID=2716417 RepID=A0AAW9PXH4_9CYAN|nr:manganese efflux pump [Tumidithrix elongata RA019]
MHQGRSSFSEDTEYHHMIIDKFLLILLLAIAANLDNLGVGIAYGLRQRYFPVLSNLVIALISAGLTLLSMILGQWLERILPIQVANTLGALIIIGVGIWVCWEPLLLPSYLRLRNFLRGKISRQTKVQSRHHQNVANQPTGVNQNTATYNYLIAWYPVQRNETILLSISLSLNAIAGGIGASLSGYNALLTSGAIGIFSYVTIAIGQKLSRKYFSSLLGTLSQQIAGLVLIAIGIYELFL